MIIGFVIRVFNFISHALPQIKTRKGLPGHLGGLLIFEVWRHLAKKTDYFKAPVQSVRVNSIASAWRRWWTDRPGELTCHDLLHPVIIGQRLRRLRQNVWLLENESGVFVVNTRESDRSTGPSVGKGVAADMSELVQPSSGYELR